MPAQTTQDTDKRSRGKSSRNGTSDAILAKIEKLVALATDTDDDDNEEARTAAVQAVRLMREHDLALVPKKDLDNARQFVEGAQALARKADQAKWQHMGIGFAAAMFLNKKF